MTLIDDECEEVRTSIKVNVIRGALIIEKEKYFFSEKKQINRFINYRLLHKWSKESATFRF